MARTYTKEELLPNRDEVRAIIQAVQDQTVDGFVTLRRADNSLVLKEEVLSGVLSRENVRAVSASRYLAQRLVYRALKADEEDKTIPPSAVSAKCAALGMPITLYTTLSNKNSGDPLESAHVTSQSYPSAGKTKADVIATLFAQGDEALSSELTTRLAEKPTQVAGHFEAKHFSTKRGFIEEMLKIQQARLKVKDTVDDALKIMPSETAALTAALKGKIDVSKLRSIADGSFAVFTKDLLKTIRDVFQDWNTANPSKPINLANLDDGAIACATTPMNSSRRVAA